MLGRAAFERGEYGILVGRCSGYFLEAICIRERLYSIGGSYIWPIEESDRGEAICRAQPVAAEDRPMSGDQRGGFAVLIMEKFSRVRRRTGKVAAFLVLWLRIRCLAVSGVTVYT